MQPQTQIPAAVACVNSFPAHATSRIYPKSPHITINLRNLDVCPRYVSWSSHGHRVYTALYYLIHFRCNGRLRRLPRRSQKAEAEKTQRPRKRKGKKGKERAQEERAGSPGEKKHQSTHSGRLCFSSRSAQRLRDQFRPSGLPACCFGSLSFFLIQSNHSFINQSINHVGSKRTQEAPQGAHESTRKSSLCRLSRTSTAMGLVDCSTTGRSTRVAPHWRLHVLGMLGGASSIGWR